MAAALKDSAQPADLNRDFSEPFIAQASYITAGITPEEWPALRDLSDITLSVVEDASDLDTVKQAWSDLYDYCGKFIAQTHATPRGGILAKVIDSLEQQAMSPDQFVAAFATVINGFPTP